MNVKKMFASLAGVLMLAQAAAPMVTGAATYSDELQGAYDYAYSKGITTMTSIDNANMYGELTRGQLSKMISQWAEKEMWVKADETASCSFSDASTAEGDLATWVVKACQMGLMGQGINAFRPNDKVTRGEFGTVLSRAIWGDKYNQENPFYAKHLQALKDAGIMTKIEEPNSLEIRGWVMLMLQRAAETVSGDDECNDPAVLLACALGSTGCPAKCSDEAQKAKEDGKNPYEGVQAGDLSVAVSTSSNVTSIPNSGVIKVAELAVKASENIQLQSISITRQGLSQNSNLKVWIEKDGRRITSSSSFFGDSKANLTFNNNGYVVNGNETLDLVVSLNEVTAGSELQFKVSDLVSSAKSSSISPDTTGLFRTADYKATSISIVSSTANSPRNYNIANDTTFSFWEFKVQNDSKASMEKDVMIKSITFKVEGSIENLANFKLLRDSKEVSSKYTVDGKSLTFAVNDQLDSGKSATYKVTAEPIAVENAATADDDITAKWDTYTLSIKKDSDIIAEEIGSNATAYRVSVYKTNSETDWDAISLGTTTIKWGNITLTRDSNFASTVNANWWYSDVVIAKGTMKVNQAVKFEKAFIELKEIGETNLDPDKNWLNEIIRRAALVIDGKTYQAEATKSEVAKQGLSIGSEIYLSKGDHKVELQVSLNNQKVKLEGADDYVKKISFKAIDQNTFVWWNYTNGDETQFKPSQIAGTINVSSINVQEMKMSLKKTGPADDLKISAGNTDEKVLIAWEISNTTDKVLEINKVTLTSKAALPRDIWYVYLVLGDNTSSNVAVNKAAAGTTTVDIDSITTSIEAGKSEKFEVRYIPSASLEYGDASFQFDVTAGGKLDGNDTSSSIIRSATVSVNGWATTTIVGNTTDNKLIIKPGVSTKIASFNYNVKSDSVDLTKAEFVVENFDDAELDGFSIDFGGSVGAPSLGYKVNDDGDRITVTFDNAVALPEANYKVSVYATFNTLAAKSKKANGDDNTLAWKKKSILAVAFNGTDNWYTPAEYYTTVAAYNAAKDVQLTADEFDELTPAQKLKTASSIDTTKAKGAASLSFWHWVAKAYPILSVKDKNTSSDNARLDLNIRKSNDDANTVKLTNISATTNAWAQETDPIFKVIEGTETDLSAISLDANNATVIRSSNKWTQVNSINFSVTDDEGDYVTYTDVNAGSDFASLSI